MNKREEKLLNDITKLSLKLERQNKILVETVKHFKYMLPLGTGLQAKATDALREIEKYEDNPSEYENDSSN